jgi:MscS family membrane protein
LRLRYGTTARQMSAVLGGIRALLAGHPRLEKETSRVRLVDFGAEAIQLELFAYVLTADLLEFLALREDLLLQVGGIVESSGSGFAQPNRLLYTEPDGGGREGRPERADEPTR